MVTQKETEEFLIRLAGAMTGGLEDAALEANYMLNVYPGSAFPYTSPNPKIIPYDDLIVGGLAIPPWVIGALMEKDAEKKGDVKTKELGKNLRMFGEGDAIYALNMCLEGQIRWLMEPRVAVPRVGAAIVTQSSGSQQKTDLGHKITKL